MTFSADNSYSESDSVEYSFSNENYTRLVENLIVEIVEARGEEGATINEMQMDFKDAMGHYCSALEGDIWEVSRFLDSLNALYFCQSSSGAFIWRTMANAFDQRLPLYSQKENLVEINLNDNGMVQRLLASRSNDKFVESHASGIS